MPPDPITAGVEHLLQAAISRLDQAAVYERDGWSEEYAERVAENRRRMMEAHEILSQVRLDDDRARVEEARQDAAEAEARARKGSAPWSTRY